uniref:Uncharacterized protein n=1 Tax=Moumouvirus sp. 'Monve' TaxID=1128131 RepID=H2EEQ1_9VIRU|nr:hypothetical protein mv_L669 [Moumouvirus Monve]
MATDIINKNISCSIPIFDLDVLYHKEKKLHPDILLLFPEQFIMFYKKLAKNLTMNYDFVDLKNNFIEFKNIFDYSKKLILENMIYFDDVNKKILISFNTHNFKDEDYDFVVSTMENILGYKIYTKRKYENFPSFDNILSRYYPMNIDL